ncbi:hypothetical protein ACO0LF_28060 [Undibacterium sp. Di27W]|uniref:hypothetical protein n=1 Tax=Undibacterium sp. Di27W TaxID=3413036 RepID=UPI003BEFA83E
MTEQAPGPLRASCQLLPWSRSIDLRLARRHAGKLHTALPLHFQEVPEGQPGPPALCLQYEDAQQLMDELWNCGLRPHDNTGSPGSSNHINSAAALAATERHLKDMRDMAFCLLGAYQA